ncbi:MAG: hypothetical protein LC624_06090 [Halobacteriales archaeon]|nr:hypothetical protein [Halobacteriales archaeon]
MDGAWWAGYLAYFFAPLTVPLVVTRWLAGGGRERTIAIVGFSIPAVATFAFGWVDLVGIGFLVLPFGAAMVSALCGLPAGGRVMGQVAGTLGIVLLVLGSVIRGGPATLDGIALWGVFAGACAAMVIAPLARRPRFALGLAALTAWAVALVTHEAGFMAMCVPILASLAWLAPSLPARRRSSPENLDSR